MTVARRFAGITPEVVENVRTGEKIEGWLAWSHTLLASRIGAKPEHAGVGAPIPLHTSAWAAVLEPGNGYRSEGNLILHSSGNVLPGPARNGVRTQIDPAMCMNNKCRRGNPGGCPTAAIRPPCVAGYPITFDSCASSEKRIMLSIRKGRTKQRWLAKLRGSLCKNHVTQKTGVTSGGRARSKKDPRIAGISG